jgi:cytochrome c oxidase subunit II
MMRAMALGSVPLLGALGRRALAQAPAPQLVKLMAQRFHYTPSEFRVKPGEVVLEITSLDFVHGFNMPDLKLRADLPPGRVTQVRLTVEQPGEYAFLCDNFCGDQHEQMGGRMIVDGSGFTAPQMPAR